MCRPAIIRKGGSLMEKQSDKVTLKETWKLHFRAMKLMRQYTKGSFAVSALYQALKAVSPYVTIWLSAQLINELAGARRPELLQKWVLLALVCSAGLTLVVGILEHIRNVLKEKWYFCKRYVYGDKMMSMDFADADSTAIHDLLARIRQNENWNSWGFGKIQVLYEDLIASVFGIGGAVALTVSLFTSKVPATAGTMTVLNHPVFVLTFATGLILTTLISPYCSNRANEYFEKYAGTATLGNRLFSFFGFRAMGQERALDMRMYHQGDICANYLGQDVAFGIGGIMHKLSKGPIGIWYASAAAISSVLTGLVYVFVCLKAWAGAFGVGSVTQYVGAVTSLVGNIAELVEVLGLLRLNATFLRLVFELLDTPNTMYQGSLTTEKRSDKQYEIEFKDVSFRYPGSEQWALRHVNMKFNVGSRLAIVGENGSGKTTFIKLLCRLYDPQEGQILLNGIDIRKYDYRDYMDIFAVVFQDFQLISQPLGANVAGSQDYDRQRVEKALQDAGFADRLDCLEKGLDTMLYKEMSGDGVEVSGGEAQKIAIARALYKDASFIILDEPTAALDPIAEAEIYSKFNDIVGDKTALYISHRLSSCKFCDEIAVFHEGSVIQQGSHEDLVSDTDGKYYELWNAQAQYYVNSAVGA